MRRGQASPAGARKGGALTRAIARQNGKRQVLGTRTVRPSRCLNLPLKARVSTSGEGLPSKRHGIFCRTLLSGLRETRPASATPVRASFDPPSRSTTAEFSANRQTSSDPSLFKEPSGSPTSKMRDKAKAVSMMKRAQTAVLSSPKESADVDLSPKKASFAPDVMAEVRKRAMSVPSTPEEPKKSSQPLTTESLPKGPARRNVITPDQPEDPPPRAK
eukprot:symbB.v1.2.039902.t1/scaffold6852.1/size15040/3